MHRDRVFRQGAVSQRSAPTSNGGEGNASSSIGVPPSLLRPLSTSRALILSVFLLLLSNKLFLPPSAPDFLCSYPVLSVVVRLASVNVRSVGLRLLCGHMLPMTVALAA